MRDRLRTEGTMLAEKVPAGANHARTPYIVADLALGLWYFLEFARAVGAVIAAEADALWHRGWAALLAFSPEPPNRAATGGPKEPSPRVTALRGCNTCV